jgi:transposase-like protein
MVFDHERDHPSRWGAVTSIAEKIGCVPQTLHEWVKKAEVNSGKRAGVPTEVADKVKALEREGPRAAAGQRDSTQGVRIFCAGGARPPVQAMIAFIDDHRDAYGVEPICRVLPIAPSTYHERVAQRQDPTRLSARARHDLALKPEIARVFAENFAPNDGVPFRRLCTVPTKRTSDAAIPTNEDPSKVRFSSCRPPQPFQSGTPPRRSRGLQRTTLGRTGRVAGHHGLNPPLNDALTDTRDASVLV